MKKELFILLVALLLSLFLLVILLFYLYTVDLIVKQAQQRGRDTIARVAGAMQESSRSLQEIARNQADILSAHIIVVDTDFSLLADSHSPDPSVSGKYINADLSEAKKKTVAASAVRDRRTNTLSVSVAQKIAARSRDVIVWVSFEINEVRRLTVWFLLWLLLLVLLVAGMVFIVINYALKRYRRPIRKLVQYTRDAAASGFSKISVDTSDPELSRLVENFNSLVDRYSLLVETDNKKYSRINTLLANLKTGILMVDPDNAISLVNPRAEALLDLDTLTLFKNRHAAPEDNQLVSRILLETEAVNRTMTTRELTLTTAREEILEIHIEAIRSKYAPYRHSGALVIIRDVTEMRRLERLKDQFISNVSHELRTPLTVIGGFADTLKSWDALSREDRNTAVGIIDLETERLRKLVSELLLLSRIDAGTEGEPAESFSPREVIEEVLTALEPLAGEKGIHTHVDLDPQTVSLYGVQSWFRQIIFNLCENAVKYTPAGGSIRVFTSNHDFVLHLTVSDSGPGVPEEERERIFERFYQINRSPNSKNAGSGLGLSIAAHMAAEFGGNITVTDAKGGGAAFHLTLPYTETEEDRSTR